MSKGLKALEKINHTICLAFNENNNALFNKDEFDHIDCKDIYDFVNCYNDIEKELKALNVISQNFKLVGNCLHAKNKYAESGWVFVKELEDEEEHNAWKEVLL